LVVRVIASTPGLVVHVSAHGPPLQPAEHMIDDLVDERLREVRKPTLARNHFSVSCSLA
jgi:hypothetical protein